MNILNNIILLIISSGFGYLVYKQKDKFNVFGIFAFVVLLHVVLAICLSGVLQLTYYGLYLMLLFLGASYAGYYLANKVKIKNIENKSQLEFNKTKILIILLLSCFLGFIYIISYVSQFVDNWIDLLNYEKLLKINNTIAHERYAGVDHNKNGQVSLSALFLIFFYLAPMLGGFFFNLLKGIVRLFCFVPFVNCMLQLLICNEKLGVIVSIIFFISSYLASFVYLGKKLIIKKGYIIGGLIVFVSLMFVMFLSLNMRVGRNLDSSSLNHGLKKLSVYALGHIPCFDNYAKHYVLYLDLNPNYKTGEMISIDKYLFTFEVICIDNDNMAYKDMRKLSYGAKTFFGISNFLGIAKREQGIFKEYTYCAQNTRLFSNVYSLFRCTMEDFGIIGSCIFFFLITFVGQYCYRYVKLKKMACLSISIYMIVVSSFLFIFTSIFAYTSYLCAFFMFYVSLLGSCNLKKLLNK